MSSTFFIYLVNKETKVKTYLFKLCATPARTLGREACLVYDEDDPTL